MTTPSQLIDESVCRRGAPVQERAAITTRTGVAARARDADTAALLAQLSISRFTGFLTDLTGLRSRHSLDPGYGVAMDLAQTHLEGAGYLVSDQAFGITNSLCHNVVAERIGTASRRSVVLVTAHLDSINHRDGPGGQAPGADDNASGSAGALELAAALATRDWPNDIRVILFGGEEQGLLGSTSYVGGLSAAERARVAAVINMDMIGRRNGSAPGVLIEGADVSRALIEELVVAAATWTSLEVSTSLNPFASDHVPFISAGMPAVLTIEADDSANTAVHTAADTVDLIDPELSINILRMNLAVLGDVLNS